MTRRGRKSQPVVVIDGIEHKACVRCHEIRRLDSYRKTGDKPGGACGECLHAASAARYARTIAAPDPVAFWALVDKRGEDECWLWQGNKRTCNTKYTPMTYGTFGNAPAHRVAWVLANGRTPQPGYVVRHSCDTPLCCNPKHLSEGTRGDNQRDMQVRLRSGVLGSKNPKAVLTEADVPVIRASTESDAVLAERYGVMQWAIYDCRSGHSWKHLPGANPKFYGKRKLTPAQVIALRARHQAGENCKVLGEAFGLSQAYAWQVAKGHVYKHVDE